MKPIDWTGAVDRLIERVGSLPPQQAADAAGVKLNTWLRWIEAREGLLEIPEPRGEPRKVLLKAIADGKTNGGTRGQAMEYDESREAAELARISAIPEPALRIMEQDSLAGLIRSQALRDLGRAARIEAEKAPDRAALEERARKDRERHADMRDALFTEGVEGMAGKKKRRGGDGHG